ncbi:Uncharacterised protein [Shigella sonnei]|nr:Uncharacterised protein [Shigella sonnei]
MIEWNKQTMVPTKPREGDELRVITQTLAGDTNISFAILQQRRNFLWRPLD